MAAVLKTISEFVIGLFSLAIIGTMMVFTYGALGKIFTGNLLYIMFGMLLFDIATLAWGIAFIFQSRGILQYAAAAMGFVVGLIGTIGMIGAEVMLEGMTPEQIAASPIPTYMRYGFIAVLAIHLVLVYIHHGGEPKIKEEINSGVMVGEVVDEAQRKAQLQMNIMSDALASQLMVGTLNAAIRQLELSSGMKLVTGLPAPQSQIVITYFGERSAWATKRHLRPTGNPAPPRPVNPDASISARISSGVRLNAAPSPQYAP